MDNFKNLVLLILRKLTKIIPEPTENLLSDYSGLTHYLLGLPFNYLEKHNPPNQRMKHFGYFPNARWGNLVVGVS